MLFFAYHRTTRPTGRAIATGMGFANHGTEVPRNPDFLIRWGLSKGGARDNPQRTINCGTAIWRAGDKLASLQRMQEAGIRVPDFLHANQMAEVPRGEVWLARMRRGFGGRDITVCMPEQAHYKRTLPVQSDFFSKYVPNDREYRIHVVGNDVIRVQRKYLERPDRCRSDYIKNHSNGYVFKTPQRPLHRSRVEAAVSAVEALGLDFGAVDMVVDESGLEYVLEVNTAPSCSPRTAQAYMNALADMILEKSNGDYILHPLTDHEAILHDNA